MTKKLKHRSSVDYSLLKKALTEHIQTLPFDQTFFLTDLASIATDNGYSEAHLPYAMSSLTRSGIVEHHDQHKKNYMTIIHYRRARDAKPTTAKSPKEYIAIAEERSRKMNEACMRLWRALGMPVVRQTRRAAC